MRLEIKPINIGEVQMEKASVYFNIKGATLVRMEWKIEQKISSMIDLAAAAFRQLHKVWKSMAIIHKQK